MLQHIAAVFEQRARAPTEAELDNLVARVPEMHEKSDSTSSTKV